MANDIRDAADVERLVNTFYDKVKRDEIIGYFFNDVAQVNWEKHLPVMYQFWQKIIFNDSAYKGNPMVAHQKLHQQSPITKEHFTRWQELFLETVDELFEGDNALLAKQRAMSISTVMQLKIHHGGISRL